MSASKQKIMVRDYREFAELVESVAQAEGEVVVDFADVATLKLETVQLFLSAIREDRKIVFANVSEEIRASLRQLGLLSYFEERFLATDAAQNLQVPESTAAHSIGVAGMKRILTIDDSKTMRDMLMVTLADAGFDVLQAVDGEDGISVLEREPVDLVITDINMPKMDGYEVIRQIRANPRYHKLPVLVLTTEGEVEKRAIAKEAGATGWMVKPFDPQRLVQTVNKVAA